MADFLGGLLGDIPDPQISPTTGGLLGAASAYAPSLEYSRMPHNATAGLLQALGGFGQGYLGTQRQQAQTGLLGAQTSDINQQVQQRGLANAVQLWTLDKQAALLSRRPIPPFDLPKYMRMSLSGGGASPSPFSAPPTVGGSGGGAMPQSAPQPAPVASAGMGQQGASAPSQDTTNGLTPAQYELQYKAAVMDAMNAGTGNKWLQNVFDTKKAGSTGLDPETGLPRYFAGGINGVGADPNTVSPADYNRAVLDLHAAQSRGTSLGNAPFETVTVPGPGGAPRTMSKADFAREQGVSFGGVVGDIPGASPPGSSARVLPPTTVRKSPDLTGNASLIPNDVSNAKLPDILRGVDIPQGARVPKGQYIGLTPAQQELQKADSERLEGYNKEASAGQKAATDLKQLRDVLAGGYNTSNPAPFIAKIGNTAQAFGISIPKNFDPNNAAMFDKLATDLVFSAVKKLGGQVKVAEIEGYQKANPGGVLPRATNIQILHDMLAEQKWQDARSKLGTQFMATHPGAPLAVFDDAFNTKYPLADVTDKVIAEAKKAGWAFPGDKNAGAAPGTDAQGNPQTSKGPPPELLKMDADVLRQELAKRAKQ